MKGRNVAQDMSSSAIRVGLDISALDPNFREHAARGIGRYVSELKRYFDGLSGSEVNVGHFNHRSVVDCTKVGRILDSTTNFLPIGRRTAKQQLLYPLNLRLASNQLDFDVLHFPAHMDAPSWGSTRTIVTVLDLIPLVLPELYRPEQPSWRFDLARRLEMRAIKNAEHLLAISDTTKQDVVNFLGVNPDKIVVTPLGVGSEFFIEHHLEHELRSNTRMRLNLPKDKPIVLYVGGIDPRKNVAGLIGAFKALYNRRNGECQLVLAGRIESDKQYPKFLEAVKSSGIESGISALGYVDDQTLRDLMAASDVMYFPSLYEGFGLPPLEAMAAGLAVVSSNRACLPDLLGDAALIVDPLKHEDAALALQAVIENEQLRSELSAKGRKRARNFTWTRTGEITLECYERLYR